MPCHGPRSGYSTHDHQSTEGSSFDCNAPKPHGVAGRLLLKTHVTHETLPSAPNEVERSAYSVQSNCSPSFCSFDISLNPTKHPISNRRAQRWIIKCWWGLIIIEVDGRQHFVQAANWANLTKSRDFDLYKEDAALKMGATIIRIRQESIASPQKASAYAFLFAAINFVTGSITEETYQPRIITEDHPDYTDADGQYKLRRPSADTKYVSCSLVYPNGLTKDFLSRVSL
ncbi:hypothetical protein B484DRAFT_437099 [Ochromonadaceae sp. CCMP2298]|nr:hypothetical protein B484DRAFT_437099 [Ochromonadaceae sp. CCMP2298]